MPPKVAAKISREAGQPETEEDITRPPIESESDSEDDIRHNRATIQPSVFKPTSADPKPQPSKVQSRRSARVTVNAYEKNTSTTKATRAIPSTQESDFSSPKRKSQDDLPSSAAGAVDDFGRLKKKRPKPTSSYGSYGKSSIKSSQAKASSQDSHTGGYGKTAKTETLSRVFKKPELFSDDSDTSPKNDFQPVPTFRSPGSDIENKGIFKRPSLPSSDSPVSTRKSNKKTLLKEIFSSPEDDNKSKFKAPILDDFEDELAESHPVSSPTSSRKRQKKAKMEEPPLTQLPAFKAYEDMDELAGTVKSLVEQDGIEMPPLSLSILEDDDSTSMTQRAHCPMCNKPVDPADLRAAYDASGMMNTRKQEKFCQSHQKKSAQEDWDAKGFPKIDWENLDSRISKHHTFIKTLINGADSHYRNLLNEKVQTGKERNLLKSTSNLTPGYYGGRGLCVMSENIMHEFTPLLKKMVVKDRLIAARGVTGFVQSALVPEVAVLLIAEDMDVGIEKARNLLADSASMGELIHEEIRDVVTRKVGDSEDDDELDD